MQKKSIRFVKKVCVGSTLNLGICSIFWGSFEGILGNPGEIPHIGGKTIGVYRVNLTKNWFSWPNILFFFFLSKINIRVVSLGSK